MRTQVYLDQWKKYYIKKFNAPTIYIQKLLDISLKFNISLYLDNTINYLTRNENSNISMKEILYKKFNASTIYIQKLLAISLEFNISLHLDNKMIVSLSINFEIILRKWSNKGEAIPRIIRENRDCLSCRILNTSKSLWNNHVARELRQHQINTLHVGLWR